MEIKRDFVRGIKIQYSRSDHGEPVVIDAECIKEYMIRELNGSREILGRDLSLLRGTTMGGTYGLIIDYADETEDYFQYHTLNVFVDKRRHKYFYNEWMLVLLREFIFRELQHAN
jgi:hypothetical protein